MGSLRHCLALNSMSELIQPRRIQDVIREALLRKQRGEITSETYVDEIKRYTPVLPREEAHLPPIPPSAVIEPTGPGAGRAEDQESTREDGSDTGYVSPEDFVRAFTTTHPDQETGQSQRAKLWRFLADLEWHTTKEIAESYVYHVPNDTRNSARIAARVGELRKKYGKDVIETKNPNGPISSYRRTR